MGETFTFTQANTSNLSAIVSLLTNGETDYIINELYIPEIGASSVSATERTVFPLLEGRVDFDGDTIDSLTVQLNSLILSTDESGFLSFAYSFTLNVNGTTTVSVSEPSLMLSMLTFSTLTS